MTRPGRAFEGNACCTWRPGRRRRCAVFPEKEPVPGASYSYHAGQIALLQKS